MEKRIYALFRHIIEEVRMKMTHYFDIPVCETDRGEPHFGLCPFHNEKTLLFKISKQMYYRLAMSVRKRILYQMEYENCVCEASSHLAPTGRGRA